MAKTGKKPNPLIGRWRINSMSAWEDDFLYEEVEAYIEFNDRGWGDFHFGNVQGLRLAGKARENSLDAVKSVPFVTFVVTGRDDIVIQ